jgi:hypothetical protein
VISFQAFVDELEQLGAATPEQLKVAAEVTREDARGSRAHLEELEATRPTPGQLGRAALLGATVGPVASNVNKLISSGKLHTPREVAGQMAGGVLFGAAMPYAKHEIESGAERRKLKRYIAAGHGGRLATQIETKLGTP